MKKMKIKILNQDLQKRNPFQEKKQIDLWKNRIKMKNKIFYQLKEPLKEKAAKKRLINHHKRQKVKMNKSIIF